MHLREKWMLQQIHSVRSLGWILVETELQKIIDTATRSHVAAGCWFGKREQMARTIKQGAKFNCYGNDGGFMAEAMKATFDELRKK